MKNFLCVAVGCVLISLIQAADDKTTMSVAVVEGQPLKDKGKSASLIQANADQYLELVKQNSQKTVLDIVVLPEYGLTGRNQEASNAITINSTTISEINNDDLTYLNGIAKSQNIKLVANVLENDDDDLYSTTVVLDGSDKLIAKYRKNNLNTTSEDKLKEDDNIAVFKWNDQTIGLISGDDILYKEPVGQLLKNNVTTIIYTSSLRSVAPFRTAQSLHAGFAKAHGVNLLVASINDVDDALTGSGIYEPCKTVDSSKIGGVAGSTVISGTLDLTNDCKASIQRRLLGAGGLGVDPDIDTMLHYNYDDLKYSDILNNTDLKDEVCDGSFCCEFNIASTKWVTTDKFRLIAGGGDYKVCALVSCTNDNITSCGVLSNSAKTVFSKIEISTSEDDEFFMPYILHKDLAPIQDSSSIEFTVNENGTSFKMNNVKAEDSSIAIGIVATKSGASTLHILMTNIMLPLILLKYLFL